MEESPCRDGPVEGEGGSCPVLGRSWEMHLQGLWPGIEGPWLPLRSFDFPFKEWGAIEAGG